MKKQFAKIAFIFALLLTVTSLINQTKAQSSELMPVEIYVANNTRDQASIDIYIYPESNPSYHIYAETAYRMEGYTSKEMGTIHLPKGKYIVLLSTWGAPDAEIKINVGADNGDYGILSIDFFGTFERDIYYEGRY